MKESVLDDCPAMNKNRKKVLLKKYGSISNMKLASVSELTKLPGIGSKTAEQLHEWLESR